MNLGNRNCVVSDLRNNNEPVLIWPEGGVTRVPYAVYSDPDIYAAEQNSIFRGATWNYLAITEEIPEPGDFKTTYVGENSVIVCRGRDGAINAFVNRCSHRGSIVCMEDQGNTKVFTCPYHNWSFDLEGKLTGVAFRNGIKGEGGMPDDFDPAKWGLELVRIETYKNIIFGTFSSDVRPLYDYLGPVMRTHLDRLFNGRKMKVIGRYSQYLRNNWKLVMENVRDTYHASILHLFFGSFGLNRLSMEGGALTDETGWHHISYSKRATDDITGTEYENDALPSMKGNLQLADPMLLEQWEEVGDGITNTVQTIFPTVVFQQITNSLGIRQLVPRGPEECELFWTLYGYDDDTENQTNIRVKQGNLIGPAGLVSLEDGVICDFVQRAARVKSDAMPASIVEMGGHEVASSKTRATETTVRGFWQGYRDAMGV